MELIAKNREQFGKKVGALRREGFVPAEMYGHGTKNAHIAVEEKAFLKIFRTAGKNSLVTVKLDAKEVPVLIADVHMDHISGKPLAVDFLVVDKNEAVTAEVPIVLAGEAPAAKEGLNVIQTLQELEIESLPGSIPHEFSVDISKLENSEHHIAVRDITVPKGVKVLTPPETIVVAVTEQEKEEEAASPAPAEAETPPEAEKTEASS